MDVYEELEITRKQCQELLEQIEKDTIASNISSVSKSKADLTISTLKAKVTRLEYVIAQVKKATTIEQVQKICSDLA